MIMGCALINDSKTIKNFIITTIIGVGGLKKNEKTFAIDHRKRSSGGPLRGIIEEKPGC
jgi:hypothetical protein